MVSFKGILRGVFGGDAAAAGAAGLSDQGRQRDHNEDTFLVDPQRGLFLLSDGMGGHNAGEVASRLAVEKLSQRLDAESIGAALGKPDAVKELLLEAVALAHAAVLVGAADNPDYGGMGCTVVVALADGHGLHLCHVGDSRAYLLHGGGLRQLTNDHSLVNELVEAGRLTPSEALTSPLRGELTQALGAPFAIQPDLTHVDMESGDWVLMCSDGLSDMLGDDEIAHIAGSHREALPMCQALVEAANQAGGKDNITVVAFRRQA